MTLPSQTPVVVTRIQNRRGTQDQFNALYPVGYTGIGGYGDINFPGFNETNYPNVLLPGELALCTDSRRIFIGNINGEYIELEISFTGSSIDLAPVIVSLPPTLGNYLPVPSLEIDPTAFQQIFYSITDSASNDANAVGTDFSASGILTVTATSTTALVNNTMAEENTTSSQITFVAEYNGDFSKINILYNHDFPGDLVFSTGTVRWISL